MATLEQASVNPASSVHEEIEYGSYAPSVLPDEVRTKLVIATYNIRYAVGSHLISGSLFRRLGLKRMRRRPRLVSSHVKACAQALANGDRLPPVDILALQEADRRTVRAGRVHVAEQLAREMKMNYAHAPFDLPRGEEPQAKQWYLDFEERLSLDETGDTGISFLARLPLENAERINLPWSECEWRPHLALAATIRAGGKTLTLYNAHIDPHANIDERLRQHEAILDHAQEVSGAVVLLGDFNTLTSESRLKMRGLLEAHGYATPFSDGTATWRAGLIRLQTDWIFVRGARVTRSGVARGLSMSDHWPVWAEIDLSESGTA